MGTVYVPGVQTDDSLNRPSLLFSLGRGIFGIRLRDASGGQTGGRDRSPRLCRLWVLRLGESIN